jgi:hypothetical protein
MMLMTWVTWKNHEELGFQMVMGELRFREVDNVDL